MIEFKCSCGKEIKVPTKYAGKRGKCPNCHKILTIPASKPKVIDDQILEVLQPVKIKIEECRFDDIALEQKTYRPDPVEKTIEQNTVTPKTQNIKQPSCPYCKAEFLNRKPPKRRSVFKCSTCQGEVTVDPHQFIYPSVYLTEKQATYVSFLWQLDHWVFTRGSKNDYQQMKAELAKKFRTEPGVGDVIWGLMNKSLMECDQFECGDVQDLMKEFRKFESQLKNHHKSKNGEIPQMAKKSPPVRVIDTTRVSQSRCNLCGDLMIKKTVSSGNVSGIALALLVFATGLFLTISGAFCGGFLVGIPLCILALFMGGKRQKVLRCKSCGHTVNRS